MSPEAYRRAIEATLTAEDSDALIVIYTPVDPVMSRLRFSGIDDRPEVHFESIEGRTYSLWRSLTMASGFRRIVVGATGSPIVDTDAELAEGYYRVTSP